MAAIYFNTHVLKVRETYDEVKMVIEFAINNKSKFCQLTEYRMCFDETNQKMSETIKQIAINIEFINYIQE
jgi:hypothetical protein